jgi:phosphatidylinositol alpha-mannosyltransferase
MRIALVCPYNLDDPGGVQKHVLSLYHFLKNEGHYVKIITPAARRPPFKKDMIFISQTVKIPTNITSVHLNLIFPGDPLLVKKIITKEKFEIIHFHEPAVPFLSWQLMNATQGVKIATFHSAFQGGLYLSLFKEFVRPLSKIFIQGIDGVIAVSSAAWDSWSDFLKKERDVIIPNGIDLNYFSSSKTSRHKGKSEILFVGRLEGRKGILDLLKAFKILSKRNSKVFLKIVGWGPQGYQAKLFATANHLSRVKFAQYIPEKKLLSYYHRADICCFPSLEGESFGVVLLEAMAMGKPLVVYANEGYRQVLKDYPWKKALVPPADVHKLADALADLVRDKDLQLRLSEWGIKEVGKYSWEDVGLQILNYYKKICQLKKEG